MKNWIVSHSLIILLALGAIFTLDWLIINKKRLGLKWYSALILAVLPVLTGVGCVKLFALAEAGFNAEAAGSMSMFGSIFFLPLAYFLGALLFKRNMADVFDLFTVPQVFTLLCARINCLASGCCVGLPIGETGIRWPTREIELVFYAAFLFAVIPLVYKGKSGGRAFPLFMISYGAFRFVIEFFRENKSLVWIFHLPHVWALATLALGVVILSALKRRRETRTHKPKKI